MMSRSRWLMVVVLVVGTAIEAFAGGAQPTTTPPPRDLDCGVRRLALSFGAARIRSAGLPLPHTMPEGLASLHAALRLQDCPSTPSLGLENCQRDEQSKSKDLGERKQQAEFYVSLNGADTNPGTFDRPFRTIERARDVIRLIPVGERPPTTVYIREGVYHLSRPLTLEPEDGGTDSAPITYSNYGREHVMLSGGVPVPNLNWKPFKSGVYVASIDPRQYPGLHEPFTSLFVNGQRQMRARYPNGNPQDNSGLCFSSSQLTTEGCPGYLSVLNGTSDQLPTPPTISVDVDKPRRGGEIAGDDHWPNFHYVIARPPFSAKGFGPLFSFWNNPYSRPSRFVYDSKTWTNKTWSKVDRAVVHMFHDSLWGNWMFHVASVDHANRQVRFSSGGWQEARGGSTASGQHYYIENVLEELDAPGEWYLDYPDDPSSGAWTLYYYPNSTDSNWQKTVVIPHLESVVEIRGFDNRPVKHVRFYGMQFGHTITTFLHPYEVPSGGDWSIHRGGTVYIENAEHISVERCLFDQTGGNGLFMSNRVKNSLVSNNEFRLTGDSAIALIGSSQMIDGTADTYPSHITIANNHIHDIGVFGKQVSCFTQSVASQNRILDNVCYNGPRAGFNFNDGFGGGNLASGNLVFNMVRETRDHGSIKQPYVTVASPNVQPSIVPEYSHLTRNFIINGYSGVWTLDHDDGSAYYNDSANFLVYGGCKNYLGHHKTCANNVIVYPSFSAWGRRCVSDDNGQFASQFYFGNECYEPDGNFYSWSNCNVKDLASTVYHTWDNRFYSADGNFTVQCGAQRFDLSGWQRIGQDAGSLVTKMPRPEDIVSAGRRVLRF